MNLADRKQCSGCGACVCKCNNSAITMLPDDDGFIYPAIDTEKCIECGLCRESCPVLNPRNIKVNKVAYGAISKDENIVKHSSSGGVFTELARLVLDKNGAVCGVAYSEDYKSAFHTFVEKEEDLDKLRGSKYVQSDTFYIYRRVKLYLDLDRYVLFSGVPCQVNALKQFLNIEYPKLLTVEIVCHGVPSSKMHGDYIEYLKTKYKSEIDVFSQRYKRLKLSGPYYYYARFRNGKEYKRVLRTDYIGSLYNRNLILRPSCYNCQAKLNETQADLTIGDFWGAENYSKFKSGNSSIIVANTQKGVLTVESLRERLEIVNVEINTILKSNKSINTSSIMPKERASCLKDYSEGGFSYMLKKHYKISVKDQIIILLDSIGILDTIVSFKRHVK